MSVNDHKSGYILAVTIAAAYGALKGASDKYEGVVGTGVVCGRSLIDKITDGIEGFVEGTIYYGAFAATLGLPLLLAMDD
jgi:hypothetical protein